MPGERRRWCRLKRRCNPSFLIAHPTYANNPPTDTPALGTQHVSFFLRLQECHLRLLELQQDGVDRIEGGVDLFSDLSGR